MVNFDSRVAVITGAGSGIGHEIACQLALANASVVVNDLDPEAAQATVTKILNAGGAAVVVEGDCSNIDVIDGLIAKAVSVFGRLDFAIANAGITTFGSFLDYDVDDFQKLVDVNLRGSFYLAQRAARQLILQNTLQNTSPDNSPESKAPAENAMSPRGGRLLMMSSVTGIQYHPDLAAYGMSKAAIRMLARSLGAELGPQAITVNAIAPGATLTERTLQDEDYAQGWSKLTPTGRVSITSDIASAALFLLSPAAAQITGQTLVVDGGWTTVSPPPR